MLADCATSDKVKSIDKGSITDCGCSGETDATDIDGRPMSIINPSDSTILDELPSLSYPFMLK